MKNASTAAINTIKNDVEVQALPVLIAEWEHNRFSDIDSITVTPTQSPSVQWASIYDLDSITEPNRPKTGLAKARFNYNQALPFPPEYRDSPESSRYYIPGVDDVYKYFSTTQTTATSAVGGNYFFSSPIQITLLYDNPVYANKVLVGFETTYAEPEDFTVEVTYNGTTWSSVSGGIDSFGQLKRWRTPAGAWTATQTLTGATQMRGIRVTVQSMSRPGAHLDILQLGLLLEQDLTPYLESYSKEFEVSNRSVVAPIGEASSNMASVTLSNTDQIFNNDNEDSPYHGLIGKRVRFTLDLNLDLGSSTEKIREFTMWVDGWGGQEEASASISLKDSSMFLQEIEVPNVFWQNLTVGAVIWQLMDVLGFTNYAYSRHVLDTSQSVPYFWPKDNAMAWELMSELARGTQTAIYFDEYDVLQIKSHRAAFDPTETVVWQLDAVTSGLKLPDVVNIEVDDQFVTNKVQVDYRPARYSDFNDGRPKMETVWEPEEGTVTLRSSPLVKDLLVASTDMWIRQTDAAFWLYESMINIRGEILRYKGKEYVLYKIGGSVEKKWIFSQEEKELADTQSDPSLKWKNYFTGRLKIEERGMFGSGTVDHKIKQDTWSGAIMRNDRLTNIWNNGFLQKDGYVQMTSPPNADERIFHLKRHETAVTAPYVRLGGRFRFSRGGFQSGGFWFGGNNLDSGYYLNFQTTEHSDTIDKREWRHEMSLMVARTNGTPVTHVPASGSGGDGTKGYRRQIDVGAWYDIDIIFKRSTGGTNPENITVFINGVQAGNWRVDAAFRPGTTTGRWGLFVRGLSQMDFDHAYSVGTEFTSESDTSTWLDLRTGSFTSGYIQRDWKYDTTTINPFYKGKYHPQMVSRSNYAFVEFGPQVHEMRVFDVKFDSDSVPVQHSSLYMSNTSQVAIIEYTSDPFGAKFLLANASRDNAVVSGEDSLTFGIENVVNQKMFVYGRALYQNEDQSITKENEASIRRNGVSALTFESRFIQTKNMAEDVAQWVVDMWGEEIDEISAEIFGNPFLQLGDLVSLNYPMYDMSPSTHKYFVVALSNSFSQGLDTRLTLRRARS